MDIKISNLELKEKILPTILIGSFYMYGLVRSLVSSIIELTGGV